MHSCKRSLI